MRRAYRAKALNLCNNAIFKEKYISQTALTLILGVSITFGLLSVAGIIESWMKSALGYESFRWTFISALAFIGYISRIDAVNDINAIFHIDANALPLTTIAGTVFRFATRMYWPIIIILTASGLALVLLIINSTNEDKDQVEEVALTIRIIAAFISSGLASILICYQLNDENIRFKLYRVAQKSDFVSNFNCKNIDPKKFNVLFIGPDQRRVLLSPKIESKIIFPNENTQQLELMQAVEIPDNFPMMDCLPNY